MLSYRFQPVNTPHTSTSPRTTLTYRYHRLTDGNYDHEIQYLKDIIADLNRNALFADRATSTSIELPGVWHGEIDTNPFYSDLAKLTHITDLELTVNSTCTNHEKYIRENKTVTSLIIALYGRNSDSTTSAMRLYESNTILKSLVVRIWLDMKHKFRFNLMKSICDLVSRNTTLQNLEITRMQFTRSQTKSILTKLNLNNTLTGFWLIDSNLKSEKCVALLAQNTTLRSLRLKLNASHDTPAIYQYIKRNISKQLHLRILNYSLIFHNFPAYVLLEILDWLPDLYAADHVTKIHLIISAKKSISECKK